MSAFNAAERMALIALSAGTFQPDAPDLAAQRWRATTTQQDAAGAYLMHWGIVTYDHAAKTWALTPEGVERAHITAQEAHAA